MTALAGQDQGPLILCAHGTRSEAGRAAVRAVVQAVAERAHGTVRDAYVDVHGPTLTEVVCPGAVVVPFLLAPGHHVRVDIADAVAGVPDVRVAPTLGPSVLLVDLLADRLAAVGLGRADGVVLAAAGSSDDASARTVEVTAAALGAVLERRVEVAYGASRAPAVPDQVAAMRSRGHRRVVVASYLLATGHFHRRLLDSGADAVTAPLVDGASVDPRLVGLVLDRYRGLRRPTGSAGPASGGGALSEEVGSGAV